MLTHNDDLSNFDKILDEINSSKKLTKKQEEELIANLKKGDKIVLEKLTKTNLNFVIFVAEQYQNQGVSMPELIHEANIGLINAAKNLPKKDFSFYSYAIWVMRDLILKKIDERKKEIEKVKKN